MAQEIENIQDKLNWHWRNSMRPVRFFQIDARAAFACIIIFFNLFSWKAWLLVISVFMFFYFLERKGLTFPAALRNIRLWLIGMERPGLLSSQRKNFIDFG